MAKKKSSRKAQTGRKAIDIDVKPHVDRHHSFLSVCPVRRATLNYVLAALRELVTNSEDEGATEIRIIVDHKRKVLRVDDNGGGFEEHQKEGFFWLFRSEKREARKGRGTTGQHGTGRLRTLQFAQAIIPTTLSGADDKTFYRTSLTREDAEAIWNGDETPRQWKPVERPEDWHLRPGQTGSSVEIKLSDEQWRVFPTATEIVDSFAKLLSPRLEQLVRVNGRYLKPRSIMQAFEQSFSREEIARQLGTEAAEALGEVLVQLYMPERLEPDDNIKLGGAKNTICPLRDFVDGLPDKKLASSLPRVLSSGKHVFGYVFIEGLNAFAAEDRHSLTAGVYDGMHEYILKFLADVVGPRIEDAYKKKEQEDSKRGRKKRLADFSKEFGKAFEKKRNDKLGEEDDDVDNELPTGTQDDTETDDGPKITVRPGWFHILPGETQVLNVTAHDGIKEADLEWSVDANGSLSDTTGKSVTFTAEALGKAKITVRDRKHPETEAVVNVTVVAEKKLSISPPKVPVEQGGSQRFRARNSGATSGKLTWELGTKRGMKLSNTSGLETVLTVSDDCPLGEYVIICRDSENDSLEVTATFEVVPPDAPSIELDGKLYYLRSAAMRQPAPVVLEQDVLFTTGKKKAGKIEVDFDHPDFAHLAELEGNSKEAHNLLLFESMVLLHLQAEHDQGRVDSVEDLTGRFQEHRSKFLAERTKKRK